MRQITIILTAILIIIPAISLPASAGVPADIDSVRLMLTAPDNQDLSFFETDSLVDALLEIAMNDPSDAAYHDRVVRSALVLSLIHI